MKRLLTLLVLVLCSCTETFVGEEIARPNNEILPDLTAAFADEEATRTYVENGKYLRWHEDDRITAFYGNTLNRQYKFNGTTGDNSGTFSLVPSGELGTGNTLNHIYALYPYSANTTISDEGVISLTLSDTQTYAENSFGIGANTMVAVTENLEDTFLAFKNACGYLKLKLYNAEGATLKSIEIKGNNGEKLAGEATLTINYGETPILTMADAATDTITLDCGEGVTLGTTAEEATELWVVVPATTFTEGLTITATEMDGKVFEKTTTNEVVIERNAIQPMAALEARFVATKPAKNEIWYTATAKVTPYKTNAFGANIVSNTYDTEKKCWVIKFDGEVTKIGDSAFNQCESLTSVTIPDSTTSIGDSAFILCTKLKSINIPDSVTTIGDSAFNRCDSLTSITIPNSVTTIKNTAFAGCYSLISITIPNSVTTLNPQVFSSCTSLTSVTIPNSVITILNAFSDCDSLTTITIPDSVTTIGESAFSSCDNLTSVTIGNSVTTIGKQAFSYCKSLISISIPDSVTAIGESAFSNCDSLTSITIPDSVTAIEKDTFSYCNSLTSVTIGNSVTSIGDSAFSSCRSLISITIPDSVTTIGKYTFQGCYSLTSITIPDGLTTIGGDYAFYYCDNLKSVYCKATTPPSLGNYAFSSSSYNLKIYVPNESVDAYKSASGWSKYASKIIGYNFKPAKGEIWYTNGSTTEATTPYQTNVFGANIVSNTYDAERECWTIKFDGDVTTIGEKAFYECSSLTSVTIPDSVTAIESEAFYGCSSLTSITIPDSVTMIGVSAFNRCSSLTNVTIPNSVTTIRDRAFYGCSGLTSINIPNGVHRIGMSVFDGCSSLTSVVIPDSVTEIGSCAFRDCSSLTSVTIPIAVSTIGSSAFRDCSSLISVYYKTTFANPSGGDNMFDGNAPGRKIYVRRNMVEYIKAAEGWSEYASDIVGYDFVSYSVNLNSQWRLSTSVSNPDSSLYDGVYESYSNYNVNNGVATMYIDINGYTEFTFYVRSNAESNYDYVTVSELDSTSQKVSTSGKQNSGTALSNYTKVTYTGIDGGSHRIIVTYRKDGSVNQGSDRGYVLIPKNQ